MCIQRHTLEVKGVEKYHIKLTLIDGALSNIKITFSSDNEQVN